MYEKVTAHKTKSVTTSGDLSNVVASQAHLQLMHSALPTFKPMSLLVQGILKDEDKNLVSKQWDVTLKISLN